MINGVELSKRIQARISAWYLTHEDDYNSCATCGSYDNSKPELVTIIRIIDEETEKMLLGLPIEAELPVEESNE